MKILLLLATIFVSACASTPKLYNASNVEESQLAHLQAEKTSFFDSKFFGLLDSAYNEAGEKVIESDFWSGASREARLEAGTYIFVFKCDNGSVYGFPKTKFTLEPAKSYIFSCVGHTEKGIFNIDFNKAVSIEIKEADSSFSGT